MNPHHYPWPGGSPSPNHQMMHLPYPPPPHMYPMPPYWGAMMMPPPHPHPHPYTAHHSPSESYMFQNFHHPPPPVVRQQPNNNQIPPLRSQIHPPTQHAQAIHNNKYRTGRWSLDEKILFLYGLQKFGKGRWKKISIYVPHR
jgi:hypothetical protein